MNDRLIGYISALGVITAVAALLAAMWWQYHDGLQPCSLCWVQRGEVLALLVGFGLCRRFALPGGVLALVAALAGLATALLQLSEVRGAAPALGVCTITPSGAPSCALAGAHRVLGIALVDWSLAGFVFWTLLACGALLFRRRRTRR